jgi:hypothetical protein
MERLFKQLLTLCILASLPWSSPAQPFVHGTYYECEMTGQPRADELVENVFASVIDEQVSAGLISSWGWLSHYNGGFWRRVLYMVGSDLMAVDDARNNLIDAMQNQYSSASREFNTICGRHEDYIWTRVAGSDPAESLGADRPAAGMSIYLECDMSHRTRLNELVEIFADTHNEMVDSGTMNSWSWMEHLVGGKYTNLLLFDGASHKANLNAMMALTEALEERHGAEFNELQRLCRSHQDYMWDIKISGP